KRVTFDIDFELMLLRPRRGSEWEDVQKAFEAVSRATGITPQYSDDIDRWSSIALPSKASRLFEKIGKVEIRILDPALWSIGKLTRFLPTDVSDLVAVLKALEP